MRAFEAALAAHNHPAIMEEIDADPAWIEERTTSAPEPVPVKLLHRIVDWLTLMAAVPRARSIAPRCMAIARRRALDDRIRPGIHDDRPAVVILNSGIIHRVGANRMHVLLARTLAEKWHTVLRFDLSGIGDSEPRRDALAPHDAAMADIEEVLDYLEEAKGIRRVVLVGLCSGATQALFYAVNDPRAWLDSCCLTSYIPRTFGYVARHYGRRFLRLTSWRRILLGTHPMWRALRGRLLAPADGCRTRGAIAEPTQGSGDAREVRSMQ